jgi:hypothetical protein
VHIQSYCLNIGVGILSLRAGPVPNIKDVSSNYFFTIHFEKLYPKYKLRNIHTLKWIVWDFGRGPLSTLPEPDELVDTLFYFSVCSLKEVAN